MAKEVKMYEANDGKLYKTENGANNWNKKIEINKKLKELNMTESEVQKKLEGISEKNPKIKSLLNTVGPWIKWNTHLIQDIKPSLWTEEVKITKFVHEYRGWGKTKEKELFVERGPEFADPELHVEDKWKVDKVEDVNSAHKKVYYVDKYTKYEIIEMKLQKGEELSENELSDIMMYFDEVYVEKGEDRRWSRSVVSVYKINGSLYALNWEEGLTEMQEHSYYEQPYKVELEEKEIVTVKTIIKPIEKENE